MGMTVKLFVDWKGYKAGSVVTVDANTAMELVKNGNASIAAWSRT